MILNVVVLLRMHQLDLERDEEGDSKRIRNRTISHLSVLGGVWGHCLLERTSGRARWRRGGTKIRRERMGKVKKRKPKKKEERAVRGA